VIDFIVSNLNLTKGTTPILIGVVCSAEKEFPVYFS
jgi:hypothetical protein